MGDPKKTELQSPERQMTEEEVKNEAAKAECVASCLKLMPGPSAAVEANEEPKWRSPVDDDFYQK
ncbi:MAG: hypothetical protein ACXWP5_09660 [Bdellovibrionota bacterium]